MLVYPDLDPVAFAAGPVKVHWYGIMYVVGFVAGWWLARRRAAMPGSTWKPIDVDDLIFFAAVGVIVGGRIGWILVYGFDALGRIRQVDTSYLGVTQTAVANVTYQPFGPVKSFAYGNATSDDWNASTALTEPTSGLVPDIPILGL